MTNNLADEVPLLHRQRHRYFDRIAMRWGFALLVSLSVLVRLVHLNQPLEEYHGFRQTQTAITVWTFLQHGISLLHYETPILGAPWRMPMEFPTFQAVACGVASLGLDLDLACRLTNLLFFYLAATYLYYLCRLFLPKRIGLCILCVYLYCPYDIIWSRTAMIDFASVAFALAYLYYMLRWLRRPSQVVLLLPALVCGILGYLTKATTMPAILPTLLIFGYHHLGRGIIHRHDDATGEHHRVVGHLTAFAISVGLPALIGLLWVHYSDQVKAQSELTLFLTSKSLTAWNLGTLHQRLEGWRWGVIIRRLWYFFPVALLLPMYHAVMRDKPPVRLFILSMLAGGVVLPMIFFNLYFVHTYYWIAVTPAFCTATGYGLYQLIPRRHWPANLLRFGIVIVSLYELCTLRRDLRHAYSMHYNLPQIQVAKAIQRLTPEDGYVLISDADYDSSLLYYARRRGLMLRADYYGLFKQPGFVTYVCISPNPNVMAAWRFHRLLTTVEHMKIYRISDTPL
jgi:hypothetical protein